MKLIDLVKKIEPAVGINPLHSLRYEPGTYAKVAEGKHSQAVENARKANRCSRVTAGIIVSTSWGWPQMMGFNLYGFMDFKQTIAEFLNSEEYQDWAFGRYLQEGGYSTDDDVASWAAGKKAAFAKFYNGPGNVPEYVAKMEKVLKGAKE